MKIAKLFYTLAITGFLLGISGCASTDTENYSVRPWNTPKSWEHGLPSAMTEGR